MTGQPVDGDTPDAGDGDERPIPRLEPGTRLPMFPLGTVLLPGAVIPIHIFEPRYRQMIADVLERDGRFGVVLIERGSEVGGGDVRSDLGTAVVVVRAQQVEDGRWFVLAWGVERLRVNQWLPDDPYPQALVDPFPYADDDEVSALDERYRALVVRLRQALALAAEVGDEVSAATVELPESARSGLDAAAAVAPLGPFDRQALLAAASRLEQLELLEQLLEEHIELLEARLGAT